jgi:hypothetical protein
VVGERALDRREAEDDELSDVGSITVRQGRRGEETDLLGGIATQGTHNILAENDRGKFRFLWTPETVSERKWGKSWQGRTSNFSRGLK